MTSHNNNNNNNKIPMEKAIVMWLIVAVTVAAVAFAPAPTDAVITCSEVGNSLSPCINYVVYGGTAPPDNCCQGIKTLYNEARAPADRQAVCSCLKSVASSATPNIIANAAGLPGKCGVNIPYKISPSTDCVSVH